MLQRVLAEGRLVVREVEGDLRGRPLLRPLVLRVRVRVLLRGDVRRVLAALLLGLLELRLLERPYPALWEEGALVVVVKKYNLSLATLPLVVLLIGLRVGHLLNYITLTPQQIWIYLFCPFRLAFVNCWRFIFNQCVRTIYMRCKSLY